MLINRITLGRALRRAVVLQDLLQDMAKIQKRKKQRNYAEYALGDAAEAMKECVKKINWAKEELHFQKVLDSKHDRD